MNYQQSLNNVYNFYSNQQYIPNYNNTNNPQDYTNYQYYPNYNPNYNNYYPYPNYPNYYPNYNYSKSLNYYNNTEEKDSFELKILINQFNYV